MKTKKSLACVLGLIILAAVLVLAACSPATSTPQPSTGAPASTPPASKPASVRVILTTMNPGTVTYDAAVAWSTVLSKFSYVNVTVASLNSINAPAYNSIETGEAQLVMSNSSANYEALKGVPATEGLGTFADKARPWVRIMASGQSQYFGWMTRPDTGIKTVADLKGKKVIGNFPTLKTNTTLAYASLKAYGIDPDKDVNMVKAESDTAAHQKLRDKEVDAIHSSLGGATFMETKASVGISVVAFDPSKISTVAKAVPGTVPTTILKSYPGIDADTPVYAVIMQLTGSQTMTDDVAYEIVKTIFTHEKDMAAISPMIAEWNLNRAVVFPPDRGVPYHPGAIKFYKEKGVWSADADIQQQQILASLPK